MHKLITTPNEDNNLFYKETINKLEEAHRQAKNIKYLYTLHQKDNQVYFGLDTAPKLTTNENGLPDHSDLNSAYSEVPDAAMTSFKTKKMTISKKPYTDQWGTFVGVFKPIFKDNQVISLLCVEIDYGYYQSTINSFKKYIIMLCFGFFLITLVLIKFIYISEHNKIKAAQKETELLNQEREKVRE